MIGQFTLSLFSNCHHLSSRIRATDQNRPNNRIRPDWQTAYLQQLNFHSLKNQYFMLWYSSKYALLI